MKRDLYESVSAKIIAELERGAAPWIKPPQGRMCPATRLLTGPTRAVTSCCYGWHNKRAIARRGM